MDEGGDDVAERYVSEGRRADIGHPLGLIAAGAMTPLRPPHFVRDSVRAVSLCQLEERRRSIRRDDWGDEESSEPQPSMPQVWMRRLRPRMAAPYVLEGALGALNARRASWVEASKMQRPATTVRLAAHKARWARKRGDHG